MSDYPSRLRSMADFSPEAQTVTKIIPAGAVFLRETAAYVENLEAALKFYGQQWEMREHDAAPTDDLYADGGSLARNAVGN